MHQPNNSLPNGSTLQGGRYVIQSTLGAGGFGITYRADDTHLGRPVAIKELYPGGTGRVSSAITLPDGYTPDRWRKAIGDFLTEARTLASLRDPGIVSVYDHFEENSTAYMVMEYIDGVNLLTLAQQHGGRLPEAEVLRYITEVGNALQVVHAKGLLHRDIKPSNIMLTRQGHAVLIDFGATRPFVDEKTLTHSVKYTPGFAPPEQLAMRGRLGPTADIYSLAATCYYLLTGSISFDPEGNGRLDYSASRLRDALAHGMAFNPVERPQDVSSFIAELTAYDKPHKPPIRRSVAPVRAVVIGAGTLVVLIAALIFVAASQGGFLRTPVSTPTSSVSAVEHTVTSVSVAAVGPSATPVPVAAVGPSATPADASTSVVSATPGPISTSSPSREASPTLSSGVSTLGDKVIVVNGVTITLSSEKLSEDRGTGIQDDGHGTQFMFWIFKIENGSNQPFTAVLDQQTVKVQDSTGGVHQLGSDKFYNIPSFNDTFASGLTIPPKGSAVGQILSVPQGISAEATGLDLRMTLNGKPLSFHFPFGNGASALYAPPQGSSTLDARIPLRDGVTITLSSQKLSEDRGTGIQDDGHGTQFMFWIFKIENGSSQPFTAVLDQRTVKVQDSTGGVHQLGSDKFYNIPSFNDTFASGLTIPPGGSAVGQILSVPQGIPSSAAYLELDMTLTNVPLSSRLPIAADTAGSPPVPPKQTQLDTSVGLQSKVTITLSSEKLSEGRGTGIQDDGHGTQFMFWIFKIENASNQPFTAVLDQDTVRVQDSTGGVHQLGSDKFYNIPSFNDTFASGLTIPPGGSAVGQILSVPQGIRAEATGLDLRMTLNGLPLSFDFPFGGGPPASATSPQGSSTLDARIPLRDGVTITLSSEKLSEDRGTGIQDDGHGTQFMFWIFKIENASNQPFTAVLDQRTVKVQDSTGATYQLGSDKFYNIPSFNDTFASGLTIPPGGSAVGQILSVPQGIPSSAAYLELRMTLTNVPLTFRLPLH